MSFTNSSIKYFYIQAGAFSSEDNASYLINRLSKIQFRNSLNIKKLSKNSLHLVTIGPYDSKKYAEQASKIFHKKFNLIVLSSQSNNFSQWTKRKRITDRISL